jgi:hypothetical protein
MKEPAAVSDGHVLAESYEALRKDVLEGGEGGRTLRGRALLMFKGMAAWMKCVDEAPVCTRVPATGNEMRLPVGIEQNLVDIVATMAFATALEDRA